ncbi:MAG: diguanylate cyclase [Planctomycetaceae bacterium]|nr:diguanylate cyclase [Planctomycetaceae bacterium]
MLNNAAKNKLDDHERRAGMVDALNKSIEVIASHHGKTFDDVMSNALELLAEGMSVDSIVFYHFTKTNEEDGLKQWYHWNSPKDRQRDQRFDILPNNQVVTNWLKIAMQNTCINKQLGDMSEQEISFMNVFGIKSLLVVPVFIRGEFWGVVIFQDHINERHFDEACMDLYRSAVYVCVNAILTDTVLTSDNAEHASAVVEAIYSREKKLETLVKAAIIFLSRSEQLSDDMMTVGGWLIADMVNVDRFSVWRNFSMPDGLHASQIYRWDKEMGGTTAQLPAAEDVAYSQFGLPLEEVFSYGDSANSTVSSLPEYSILKSSGAKSIFITPILVNNVLWGFVLFGDSHREHLFDDVTAEMMRSAAFLVAHAVIQNEMERELIDRNEFNRIMFDTAPIGLTIFDENFRIIDCNDAALAMYGITKQHYIDHFHDLSPEYQPDGSQSRDKLFEVMQRTLNGETTVLEWMHFSMNGEPIPCELTLTHTTYKEKLFGLGYAYDLRNTKNMEADMQRLQSMVGKVYVDPLTGINNRRYFDENLKRVIKSLSRTDGVLSLLMIDIDHFKEFNDTYGHIEGDECLKTIAKTLANSIKRTDDFVARFGGEEFVVVLPNTSANGARVIAEKLHRSIRKCNIPHAKNDAATYATISIGGTTGDVAHTQSGNEYIKRADDMMYLSKQNGRNQSSFCLLDTK